MYDENKVDEQAVWQAKILKRIITELDTEIGKNSYPEMLIVSAHNWANKWMISDRIQQDRENNYGRSGNKAGQHGSFDGTMTEKQRKAVFVITHKNVNGQWEDRPLYSELKEKYGDWEKEMTFDDASAFIDEHGIKKEEKKKITEY